MSRITSSMEHEINEGDANIDYTNFEETANDEVALYELPSAIEALMNESGIAFDEMIDDAFPVLCWTKDGELVAWYDTEMFVGNVKGL